jgi:class 3 adenylate cyclase/tetratricopeptide (TPR) repeat protein
VTLCPSCGRENPDGFQFCGFCTAPLTAPSPAAGAEERKVVSVLFCDLVGFTAASEVVDPEDVRARLRPYHERVREALERFGGTVEKFVGDAVMAVFGAPVSHEDDAERVVRAGLRILEAIEELNGQDASLSLQVRVGVNTGEAVVSLDARPEQGEGFVTGDVVNTASRLQGAAPVNGVAVSEQTYRGTERVFDYEELEPVLVKGKAEPLRIYRPLRPRARFGSDVTRSHATPLVGRELEKPLLIGTFERAAQQQTCQLVTLVGEPGVGKSRLCAELFAHVEQRPGLTRWRQGRCLPYGEGIAFWALGEIVKAECGILESDSPQEAEAKLARAVPESEPDRAWLLARLAPLVGVPASEPASQEESFTAWRRFCEGLAADGRAVLVFEDLHWADPALLSFLEHLADWAEGVPLVLLCTARPELHEQHPGWAGGLRNATTINLAPLSDQETAQLVSSLLERAVLPAETQQQLLERAGGNPLYAEEFVRLLADRGDLGGEVEVPASVQALIAARLDTLSPERKSLLQDAAVVGKVFWAGALVEMGNREPGEVEKALHQLARKELVHPARTSSMEGEAEYGFWHLLVRDVAYGQIPRASRAARHQAAAAWLEQKAGERVEDVADVLAHHTLTALELSHATGQQAETQLLEASAIRYLTLAGERALALDLISAEQSLARALELAPPGHPQRAFLLERWGEAVHQQGRHREAKRGLEEAVALYRERGDLIAAGRVLTVLAPVLGRLGDPDADEVLSEALTLLEAQSPGPELVAAYAGLAGRYFVSSALQAAIATAERALKLADQLGLPQPANALGYHAAARSTLGEREGLDEMRHALDCAIARGMVRDAGVLYNNLALAIWLYDGPQAALAACHEGIEFCKGRGHATGGLTAEGLTLLAESGLGEKALRDAEPLLERLASGSHVPGLIEARSIQLRMLTLRGEGEPTSEDAESLADLVRGRESEDIVLGFAPAAQVLLARGQPQRSHQLLAELEELTTARNDVYYLSRLPDLVRIALVLADADLANRFLDRVEARTPLAEHALTATRAQLAEAAGNHNDAATLYADAANRWQQFGNKPEHAYALLGQGRSLTVLGKPEAEEPLGEAGSLFDAMGYKPALAETEALLRQAQAAAS